MFLKQQLPNGVACFWFAAFKTFCENFKTKFFFLRDGFTFAPLNFDAR
jgi:hypothetical protein